MTKMVLFLISFISFLVFIILVFQNIAFTSPRVSFNFLVAMLSWRAGVVLALGFILGLFVSVPMLIFVRGGGNIKITSKEEKSGEGNMEWD